MILILISVNTKKNKTLPIYFETLFYSGRFGIITHSHDQLRLTQLILK